MPARASERKTVAKTKPTSVPASGAKGVRAKSDAAVEEQAARSDSPVSVQPVEPEDAYLTGVSRSLQRRLLGLNVGGTSPQAKPVPEATSAGIHSTGSYTEPKGAKSVPAKAAKSTRKK